MAHRLVGYQAFLKDVTHGHSYLTRGGSMTRTSSPVYDLKEVLFIIEDYYRFRGGTYKPTIRPVYDYRRRC